MVGGGTVTLRCPRCRPWARVRGADGRRLGWTPAADYVGFLVTASFRGWKRPPTTCPNCRSSLIRQETRTGD